MRRLLCMAALAGLMAGCAVSTPRPLDENHPAHPRAATAPSTHPMALTDDDGAPPAAQEAQPRGGHHHGH